MEYRSLTWNALYDMFAECVSHRMNYGTGFTYSEFDAVEFERMLREMAREELRQPTASKSENP